MRSGSGLFRGSPTDGRSRFCRGLFTLAEELPETEDLLESDDDAPIIKLINAMLAEAIKEGASDIHIETFEKSLVIRFRVDGTLHEMLRPVASWPRCWSRVSR